MRTVPAARKRIGREIASVRQSRGLSQAVLAQKIGSSRRTLARVEAGEPGVSMDTYQALVATIGPLKSLKIYTPEPPDLSTYDQWTRI